MFARKTLARVLAPALAASVLAASVLFPALGATPANASGCLKAVGPVVGIWNSSLFVGTFYQGYNSCNHDAYAELDFNNPSYAAQIDWGYISIIRVDSHTGSTNSKIPGYTPSWFSGYYPVYGTSEYQAVIHFTKPLVPGSGLFVDCSAFTSWNYSTNSSPHGGSAGSCGR